MKNFILLIFLVFAPSVSTAAELLLGVLEQSQTKLCSEGEAEPAIRPLFVKVDDKWLPLDSKESARNYNLESVNWMAAYDGKKIGRIVSKRPKTIIEHRWNYPRDYMQDIVSQQGVVQLANPKGHFTGWCGTPALRPIVVVTKENFADPDGWKPFKPDKNIVNSVFNAFSKTLATKSICYIKGDEYFPYKYDASNLKALASYTSDIGKLIQVNLDREYTECDAELGEGTRPRWFFVSNKDIKLVGEGLEIVDAGDYDSNGKSEVLFWYSGYNRDGYILFYNDFNKMSKFLWAYH